MPKGIVLRVTNTIILALLITLTLTGVYGLFWTLQGWVFSVHRWAGWALIAVLPWKAGIAFRSLRRGWRARLRENLMLAVSLLLAGAALLVLVLGLLWAWRIGPTELWLRQTAISWHWLVGLGLLVPLIVHVWQRWPRPKEEDFLKRRGFLQTLAVIIAGVFGWAVAERWARDRATGASPRRFTGSRGDGVFAGNDFPVTHAPGEGREEVDPQDWALVLDGAFGGTASWRYEELLELASEELVATLDCTLGWYTIQRWRGVQLLDLFDLGEVQPGEIGVRLHSTTGYARFLPMDEARHVLLATHVGDEPLAHRHGFPLRAVVPSRRGWYWVKWLERVEVMGALPDLQGRVSPGARSRGSTPG